MTIVPPANKADFYMYFDVENVVGASFTLHQRMIE
jgi:hypothetical protein